MFDLFGLFNIHEFKFISITEYESMLLFLDNEQLFLDNQELSLEVPL